MTPDQARATAKSTLAAVALGQDPARKPQDCRSCGAHLPLRNVDELGARAHVPL